MDTQDNRTSTPRPARNSSGPGQNLTSSTGQAGSSPPFQSADGEFDADASFSPSFSTTARPSSASKSTPPPLPRQGSASLATADPAIASLRLPQSGQASSIEMAASANSHIPPIDPSLNGNRDTTKGVFMTNVNYPKPGRRLMNGQPWTEEADILLLLLRKENAPFKRIARQFITQMTGHNRGACQQRYARLAKTSIPELSAADQNRLEQELERIRAVRFPNGVPPEPTPGGPATGQASATTALEHDDTGIDADGEAEVDVVEIKREDCEIGLTVDGIDERMDQSAEEEEEDADGDEEEEEDTEGDEEEEEDTDGDAEEEEDTDGDEEEEEDTDGDEEEPMSRALIAWVLFLRALLLIVPPDPPIEE